MSIIHEALKKAQNNLKAAPRQTTVPRPVQSLPPTPAPQLAPTLTPQLTPKPEPTSEQYPAPAARQVEVKMPPPAAQTKTEPETNQPFYKLLPLRKLILAGILLVLLVAALPFLKTNPPAESSAPVPAAKSIPDTVPPLARMTMPEANAVPTPTPTLRPQLILNGISITGEKTLALINNEIYEVGDSVYGVKILSINESGVELLDGDQKLFLQTRR